MIQKIFKIKILHKIFGTLYLGLREFYQEMKYTEFRKKYNLHSSFKFNGPGSILYGDGKINIGENSYLGRYSAISCSFGDTVNIGKGCAISHFVLMYTSSRKSLQDFSLESLKKEHGNITIGDYSWIGSGVFIKHGVNIGKNCVIGANSVVTKDIPNYTVAAGCPAKVIKKIKLLV